LLITNPVSFSGVSELSGVYNNKNCGVVYHALGLTGFNNFPEAGSARGDQNEVVGRLLPLPLQFWA
jgi:hypothetical protein